MNTILVINSICIIGIVFYLWRLASKTVVHDFQPRQGAEPRPERKMPFAKPNGKRKPKVNDDDQAWIKENETKQKN